MYSLNALPDVSIASHDFLLSALGWTKKFRAGDKKEEAAVAWLLALTHTQA